MSDHGGLTMRVIVHLTDPADMIFAMHAVKASIAGNHDSCAYSWKNDTSAFVRRNKTGWTVYVSPAAEGSARSNASEGVGG